MIHLASQKVNVFDLANQEKFVTILVLVPEAFMDHNVKKVSSINSMLLHCMYNTISVECICDYAILLQM